MKSAILSMQPLGFPWACHDPFLFCAHHLDAYPAGDALMRPKASLQGRNLGQDFEGRDGWNMYHGHQVPGFPQHPHRGFETITVARQGYIDHSDSLGAAARYGKGDAQWLTTGQGISHSEMFPLLNGDQPNPTELFQIWLNLPPHKKMARPNFTIVWERDQPRKALGAGELRLVAGGLDGLQAPPPPPDSWAAQPGAEVVVALITLPEGASWTLPAGAPSLSRTLYLFKGAASFQGEELHGPLSLRLDSALSVEMKGAKGGAEMLLLQGRPIAAPVAQYGPFVMNTRAELEQAFEDYRATQFGGWPWKSDDPVHPRDAGRFARHPDGKEEKP